MGRIDQSGLLHRYVYRNAPPPGSEFLQVELVRYRRIGELIWALVLLLVSSGSLNLSVCPKMITSDKRYGTLELSDFSDSRRGVSEGSFQIRS